MLARLVVVIGSIAILLLAAAASFGFRWFLAVQSNEFINGFLCGGLFVGLLIYAIWKLDPLSFVSPKRKMEIAWRRGRFDLIPQFEKELAERKKIQRQIFVVFACLLTLLIFVKTIDHLGFKPYDAHLVGENSLSK